jgi:hypothetical protein
MMEELLAISALSSMGAVVLYLYARLRGAELDRDLGITRKD